MNIISNFFGTVRRIFLRVIWLVLGLGVFGGIGLLFLGAIWCVTIVGFPLGIRCIKLALNSVFHFSSFSVSDGKSRPVMNLMWLIFGGFIIMLIYKIGGIILRITFLFRYSAYKSDRYAEAVLNPLGVEFTGR